MLIENITPYAGSVLVSFIIQSGITIQPFGLSQSTHSSPAPGWFQTIAVNDGRKEHQIESFGQFIGGFFSRRLLNSTCCSTIFLDKGTTSGNRILLFSSQVSGFKNSIL